jgi:hypothetical protein
MNANQMENFPGRRVKTIVIQFVDIRDSIIRANSRDSRATEWI